MNFPILSTLIFLPLLGASFIFLSRSQENDKGVKYVALFTSFANFLLSIFLWLTFDQNISSFQFVEEKIGLVVL